MPSESPSISKGRASEPRGRVPAAAFCLDGPTRRLDPRVHAYRPDIADVALAGTLFAPHYAAPMPKMAIAATMMRKAPGHDAEAVSQLLPGEGFAVIDVASARQLIRSPGRNFAFVYYRGGFRYITFTNR